MNSAKITKSHKKIIFSQRKTKSPTKTSHKLMKIRKRSLIILIIFLLIFECLLYLTIGINQPSWGDEGHFIETIREFGEETSIYQLKHYNEMSTPLPFILYAWWGKIFGFQLHQLRIFSLIISLITFILYFQLFSSVFRKDSVSYLLTLFLFFQPYMIGLSVFVYTDMLMMLFLALVLHAVKNERKFLLFFSAVGGLLCRQYFIYIVIASSSFYLLKIYREENQISKQLLISSIISLIPLFLLFIFWGGLSPQNAVKDIYLKAGVQFELSFLYLYISLFSVYLFPLALFYWKYFYKNRKVIISSLIISLSYFLVLIEPSQPAVEVGVYTVGFFHRLIRTVFGTQLEHFIFFLFFLFSLPIVISFGQDFFRRIRNRHFDFCVFLDMAIISFLLVMPFSYVNWEKYFLPVIPLAAIQVTIRNHLERN